MHGRRAKKGCRKNIPNRKVRNRARKKREPRAVTNLFGIIKKIN